MSFASITPGECAAKIRSARRIAVLTGAGMSTAAGVPDFRGPKGLYVTRAYDPETVFDIGSFARDPKPFFEFTRDFIGLLRGVQPTFTHRFLAELEGERPGFGIVTQNIDGLHQRAGSRNVFPIHGDYNSSHCRSCGRRFDLEAFLGLLDAMPVPTCDCGGVVKPDVVFFGENVRHLKESTALAAASDLLLVLGSSLVVHPAAMLPAYAGGEVVIVNQGEVGMRPGKGVYRAEAGLDDFFRDVKAELERK